MPAHFVVQHSKQTLETVAEIDIFIIIFHHRVISRPTSESRAVSASCQVMSIEIRFAEINGSQYFAQGALVVDGCWRPFESRLVRYPACKLDLLPTL